MRLILVESPYRAYTEFELQRNLAYARALCAFVTARGDHPLASHLTFTQWMDDRDAEQRRQGIEVGLGALSFAHGHVFGIDLGVSDWMAEAILRSPFAGLPTLEKVSLPDWRIAFAMDYNKRSGYDAQMGLIKRYAPKWHVHEAKL